MSTGQRIADDVYWRQEHETAGKFRFDRLAELIDDAVEAEREACAQVVLGTQFLSNPMSYDLDAIAERVRNRSNPSK